MMNIGIIGAGQVGATLTRQYRKAGHHVKMANASGVRKLEALQAATGASAVTLTEVTRDVAVLVIAIPLIEIPRLAESIRESIDRNTIVIDTSNYYPIRDGVIAEIENGIPESAWVSGQLAVPVVKAYNSILAGSLAQAGLPAGTGSRIALPVSGNDARARQLVATLVNDSGFDALDMGSLPDSWRQQPGSPVYCTDLTLAQLERNIPRVQKALLPERRELALQFILRQDPAQWLTWWRDCVTNNRIVYETDLNI